MEKITEGVRESEVITDSFIEVPVTGGYVSLVDVDDAHLVLGRTWRPHKGANTVYAQTNERRDGRVFVLRLHRLILGVTDPSVLVDHRNGNGLDNRRGNLRLASRRLNNRNRRPNKNAASKFRGVTLDRRRDTWVAQIKVDGKNIRLGDFSSEDEAAVAYDHAASELFGEWAWLNFPRGTDCLLSTKV